LGSVPEALIAFLDADDFEHTLRLAISLGGDADTQAAIAGGVAEAFFGGIPQRIETELRAVLEPDLLEVVDRFGVKTRG
jgi:ADP-ribosylglycohydrolase